MSKLHGQRGIAVVGLALGPLAFAVGDLLRRTIEPSPFSSQANVTAVHAHPGAWQLAALLSITGAILLVPGVVAAVMLVRERGRRLSVIGGYAVGAGLMASVGHTVAYFGLYALYDKASIDGPTIKALDDASESYPTLLAIIAVFVLGLTFGSIVLTFGLRRASLVPVWVPVAAIVLAVAGNLGSGVAPGVIGLLAWLATFLPIAQAVRRSAPDVLADAEGLPAATVA